MYTVNDSIYIGKRKANFVGQSVSIHMAVSIKSNEERISI